MGDFLKTNSGKIAQICSYDHVTDTWSPISEADPLPVSLQGGTSTIGSVRITDGTHVALITSAGLLKVDTELSLNGNVIVDNIDIASDGVIPTKIRTTPEGFVKVVGTNGNNVALDSSLQGVKTQTDKFRFDTQSNLKTFTRDADSESLLQEILDELKKISVNISYMVDLG